MNRFKVTIEGQYTVFEGNQVSLRDYDISLTVDQKTIQNGVISVLTNTTHPKSVAGDDWLTYLLKQKYTNVRRYRTHHLVNNEPLDKEGEALVQYEPAYMGKNQLLDYITARSLPVDSTLWPSTEELRSSVIRCEALLRNNQKEQWLKEQEHRRNAFKEKLEISSMLLELNPEPKNPEFTVQQTLLVTDGRPPTEPNPFS